MTGERVEVNKHTIAVELKDGANKEEAKKASRNEARIALKREDRGVK